MPVAIILLVYETPP